MKWFVGAILALALVGILWWMEQQRQAELTPEASPDTQAEPRQPEPRHPLPKPEIHHAPGVEEGPEEDGQVEAEQSEVEPQPLPRLADSDAEALQILSGMLGKDFVERWVKPEFVIPRAVAIVNSLDGQSPALKTWPLRPLESKPRTGEIEGEEDTLLWAVANAGRYAELIAALESVPPEQAAARYARFYPLFERAWGELGESEPYFNDRLIDVIDHLLATPQPALPFEVVPHEGRLHFADESLQSESWGRKLLIRMGTEHAGRVKEWLQRFRDAAVREPGPSTQ